MEESTSNSIFDLENPAMKNGILAGIGGAVLMMLCYLVSDKLVFTLGGWAGGILTIVLMVVAVKQYKKMIDFLDFGEGLKMSFLTYVVSSLIGSIFYYVLVNYIDPGLIEVQREISIKTTESFERFMSEEDFEQALENVENQNWNWTLGKALLNYAFSLIFGFIVALIISAVMKDRKPVQV